MRVVRFPFFALAGAALLGLIPPASSADLSFGGVGRSIDGDSLYVGDREVRLFGVDAPEYHQTCTRAGRPWPCGAEAAKQLSSLINGRQLRCEQIDTDEYGRAVARCSVGTVDVNRFMVATGYAIAYRHYSNDYVSAEASAKANRRGIWAGTFEMPREYRHDQAATERPNRVREARSGTYGSRSTAANASACNIKGNRGAHGWIYHLPGMPYYNQTRAEEWFCTEEQAQAAGYRRAKAR